MVKASVGKPAWTSVAAISAVVVTLLVLDQWTKAWAVASLSGQRVITLIPGFFDLSLTYNTGAAFGFGRDWPPAWRKFFFLGVSSLAVVLIAQLLYRLRATSRLATCGLTLILAGALGNLIDRFRLGRVVDFVHVFVGNYHWPNFNVADSSICVGIGLFAIYLMRKK